MENEILLSHSIKAHSGWITKISIAGNESKLFATGSRDCIILIWEIVSNETIFALVKKKLIGHSHFISDLVLSPDAKYCISSSWDHNIHLWNIDTSKIVQKFFGHTKDVLAVSFSNDNRYIASGSRDKTVKLWNTRGECKGTFLEKNFSSWVSCVNFLPRKELSILSCHWDGVIKIWKTANKEIKSKLSGHKGYINCSAVSPDGSLCASGGKDGFVILWDLNEQKHLYSLEAGETVNSLCFSPNRYWLCAATQRGIKIWDLETKKKVNELCLDKKDPEKFKKDLACISTAWTIDGLFFLTGYIDGYLRIWSILKD